LRTRSHGEELTLNVRDDATMASELKFKDRSARVLLVDPSGPVRQLLSEVWKNLGFSNAQAVASIEDAHNILETESVDWLIVPFNSNQDVTGLHTVRMVVNFAELKGVKVSLLVEEGETWVLAKAFELGLLSFHMKPFTKDTLSKDLDELLKLFEQHDWDATKTSAEYLRRHLRATNQSADLLAFEKNLLEIFPGNTSLLINLAEAQHLNGASETAKTTLRQVEFIDASAKELVARKRAMIFGSTTGGSEGAEQATAENVLGLKTVVLIDNDEASRSAVKSVFADLGCSDIQDFSDGAAAVEWINSNPEPSMVVMEWRVPKVTGPLLIQRIRSKGFINVPIVVLSSLIKAVDMPIIREMGVANIAQKPMEREAFVKALIWTIQQDRMPTEAVTMENKIRGYLSTKKMADAEELIARYLEDANIGAGRKSVIRAEHAFAHERYEAARDFAIEAIKQSGESLFALNILGKSLMILRQFDQSLKCFQKAQSVSPMNLERLVVIAETQAETGNAEAAQDSINKSKDLDPDSPAVQEGEVKVALAAGNTDAAREILGQLESMTNVIGYLNNKAVAHAKCGFADEGIQLYEKTLAAVPTNQRETAAVVNYNMALAKIRKGDLQSGLTDIEAVLAVPEARVYKKAMDLKQRLVPAVTTGVTFSLKEGYHGTPSVGSTSANTSSDEGGVADATTLVKALMELAPGDHCCYLLFKSTAAESPELTRALATPPKFKLRKVLERGETFAGAEGTKTAS
jgi:CheY-like chemotaxis protein